jgi:hypothetical protein
MITNQRAPKVVAEEAVLRDREDLQDLKEPLETMAPLALQDHKDNRGSLETKEPLETMAPLALQDHKDYKDPPESKD